MRRHKSWFSCFAPGNLSWAAGSGAPLPADRYCGAGAWVCVVVVLVEAPGGSGSPGITGAPAGAVVVVVVRSVVVTGGSPPQAESSAVLPSTAAVSASRRQEFGEVM
jgi:hypothetical protein